MMSTINQKSICHDAHDKHDENNVGFNKNGFRCYETHKHPHNHIILISCIRSTVKNVSLEEVLKW